MFCKKCKSFAPQLMFSNEVICKSCESYKRSLVIGLAEYYNKLYKFFLKSKIVEDAEIDWVFENSMRLCDELLKFENLGINILNMEFWAHLEMKSYYNNIPELKERLLVIRNTIKETNIRIALYKSAEKYEKEYKFAEAKAIYMTLYNKQPLSTWLISKIIDMYRKLNELDKAITFLKECKQSDFYNSYEGEKIGYKYNIDKKLKDMEEKYNKGYVYRPRKRQVGRR